MSYKHTKSTYRSFSLRSIFSNREQLQHALGKIFPPLFGSYPKNWPSLALPDFLEYSMLIFHVWFHNSPLLSCNCFTSLNGISNFAISTRDTPVTLKVYCRYELYCQHTTCSTMATVPTGKTFWKCSIVKFKKRNVPFHVHPCKRSEVMFSSLLNFCSRHSDQPSLGYKMLAVSLQK